MRRDLLCALGLMAIAAALLLPALGVPPYVPPFSEDNLDALNIAASDDPDFFTRGSGNFVYRPVTYSSFWVQGQLFGLRPSVFFTTNLLIWIACSLVMFALVRQHVAGWAVPLLAAAALLTDHRVTTAMAWIIERQSLLACLFGGLALLLAFRMPRAGRGRNAAVAGVFALLTAAVMSKEYGAAFAAATASVGLVSRPELRRPLMVACAGAAAVYASMRWLVPDLTTSATVAGTGHTGARTGAAELSGGTRGYCEDLGLFDHADFVCYGRLGLGDRLVQYSWNVGATLVGTVYPYFFGSVGEFDPPNLARPVLVLLYPTLLLGLAITAWVKRPKAAVPFLVLLIANAALGYLLFRHRNLLIGMMGLYASAAIGLQPAVAAVAERVSARRVRMAIAVGAVLLVAWGVGAEGKRLRTSLDFEQANALDKACVYLTQDNEPELVALLEAKPETAACRTGVSP